MQAVSGREQDLTGAGFPQLSQLPEEAGSAGLTSGSTLWQCKINPSFLERSLGFSSQRLLQVKDNKVARQPD